MKKEDLLRAINDIDDDLILEAAPVKIRKRKWFSWERMLPLASAAAVIVMIVVTGSAGMTKNASGGSAFVVDKSEEAVADFFYPQQYGSGTAAISYQQEDTVTVEYSDSEGNVVMTVTREKIGVDTATDYGISKETLAEDEAAFSYQWDNGEYHYRARAGYKLKTEEIDKLDELFR